MKASLGFAPHSGWAAMVAVGGDAASPRVLLRERVEMADPRLQGSTQPYHEIEGLPIREAERRLEAFRVSAGTRAHESVRAILESIRGRGYAVRAAGILDSSGRKVGTLSAILASHALIHTADGDHFREALAEGCARCALPVTRVRRRELLERAAGVLRRSPEQIEAAIREMGRPMGAPWGADQKAAALLAWLLLASLPPPFEQA